MTIRNKRLSVLVSATAVVTGGREAFYGNGHQGATSVTVSVPAAAANPVFFGDANVTTANGFELTAGQKHTFEAIGPDDALSAIAVATTVIHVIEND